MTEDDDLNFSMVGGEETPESIPEPVPVEDHDPWAAVYLTPAQVKVMIADSERRMEKKLEGLEFRVLTELREEQLKRRQLRDIVNEYKSYFNVFRKFLTP